MVEAARLQTPRRRADAAVRRPASRGSKGQRRGPTKLCIRALLRASAPIISRMTEMGLTKSFSHRRTMADRALGALAAAFGSAAVEGRLLRAGVIIRKGPHRDGAPETHRHPGPDRTSWARTIAITPQTMLSQKVLSSHPQTRERKSQTVAYQRRSYVDVFYRPGFPSLGRICNQRCRERQGGCRKRPDS